MAFVDYVSKDQAAETIRPLYDRVEQQLGVMPNLFKALAHNPELFETFIAFDQASAKTKLDRKFRELAYLKTSQINDCDYCLHYHRGFGASAGLSERQLKEVEQSETSDAYDEHQRDVMRYAEALTRNLKADDELVNRLKKFLHDRELTELTVTVGLANLTNRVNRALQIELP